MRHHWPTAHTTGGIQPPAPTLRTCPSPVYQIRYQVRELKIDEYTHVKLVILQGSSERSERSVRFNPNLRSERVRHFSERETNLQALKRSISL